LPLENQAAKKKRGRPQKNIDLVMVLELEKTEKTDSEIADELGVSVRTFRMFRKEHGIAPAVGHGGARRGAGRKSVAGPKTRTPWRGKANWPAAVAATRRTISSRDAALWCGQEYEYVSPGLYRFDEGHAGGRPGDMPKLFRTI